MGNALKGSGRKRERKADELTGGSVPPQAMRRCLRQKLFDLCLPVEAFQVLFDVMSAVKKGIWHGCTP